MARARAAACRKAAAARAAARAEARAAARAGSVQRAAGSLRSGPAVRWPATSRAEVLAYGCHALRALQPRTNFCMHFPFWASLGGDLTRIHCGRDVARAERSGLAWAAALVMVEATAG